MAKSGLNFGLRAAKKGFLDRQKVMRAVERGKRRAMMTTGSRIRQEARDLLRRRKSSADPGEPPRIHTSGMRSLRKVLYYYDRRGGSLVVGPVRQGTQPYSSVTVPELMEYGGNVRVKMTDRWLSGLEARADKDSGAASAFEELRNREGQTVTLTYEPHPFMSRALKEVEDEISKHWHNAIR